MWMISRLMQFLFPATCIRCKEKETALCEHCVELLRRSLSTPEPFIISAFDFKDDTVRHAIHAIKYYHRTDLINPLADVLAQEMRKEMPQGAVLVPIPMGHMRKLVRGYNQAELIANTLSRKLNIPVRNDILARSQTKKRQATIRDRATRLTNQSGSFKLLQPWTGKIILIDDVTTTGATLVEAKKILQKSGAQVYAATLAH